MLSSFGDLLQKLPNVQLSPLGAGFEGIPQKRPRRRISEDLTGSKSLQNLHRDEQRHGGDGVTPPDSHRNGRSVEALLKALISGLNSFVGGPRTYLTGSYLVCDPGFSPPGGLDLLRILEVLDGADVGDLKRLAQKAALEGHMCALRF